MISNEITMTHPGPMATNVRDVARMLSVIAGPDPLDSRTHGVKPTTTDYTASLRKDIRGLRVGILQEGFNQAPWTELGLVGSEPVVDQKCSQPWTVFGTLAPSQPMCRCPCTLTVCISLTPCTTKEMPTCTGTPMSAQMYLGSITPNC